MDLIDCVVQGKLRMMLNDNESKQLTGFQRVFYTAGPVSMRYAYNTYPIKKLVRVKDLPEGFKKYAVHQYCGTWKRDWFGKRFPDVDIVKEIMRRRKYEKDCLVLFLDHRVVFWL